MNVSQTFLAEGRLSRISLVNGEVCQRIFLQRNQLQGTEFCLRTDQKIPSLL